jgi:hypothetical protein
MIMGLQAQLTKRVRIFVLALALAMLLGIGPVAADAALHTGLVPAALADGPQRSGGG